MARAWVLNAAKWATLAQAHSGSSAPSHAPNSQDPPPERVEQLSTQRKDRPKEAGPPSCGASNKATFNKLLGEYVTSKATEEAWPVRPASSAKGTQFFSRRREWAKRSGRAGPLGTRSAESLSSAIVFTPPVKRPSPAGTYTPASIKIAPGSSREVHVRASSKPRSSRVGRRSPRRTKATTLLRA